MWSTVGEVVSPPRQLLLTDSTGAPVDADALPTWTVTLPDGTAGASPAVQHGTTGEYWVNFLPAQAGMHVDLWSALVGGQAVAFGPDVFHVQSSSLPPVAGLAETRTHLGILRTDVAQDEELRGFLLVASELAEEYTGLRLRRQSFTETHDGGVRSLLLRHRPVLSVTTVTENGQTLSGGYVLDALAGVLHRGTTVGLWPWLPGHQNVTVTLVAGLVVVPYRYVHGVKEITRHLWETQRGGSGLPAQQGSQDDWISATGWSVPRRVMELLGPRAPGIA